MTKIEPNDLVGKTPLIRLGEYGPATLWVKDEGRSLTGSVKDRTAKMIVGTLAAKGAASGKELIDTSSGSYGCALAMQARLFDLPATLVVNEKISKTNLNYLEKLGATVVRHGKVTGDGLQHIEELLKKDPGKYAFTDQLNNPLAVEAHYVGTAPEIFRDIPEPAAVVVSIGSGATALGIARYIRKHGIATKLFGSVGVNGDVKKVAGTYRADSDYVSPFIKELLDRKLVEQMPVGYQDSMDAVWEHLIPYGVQTGPQSGGVLLAAFAAIDKYNIRGDVVVVAGDSILKNMDRYA